MSDTANDGWTGYVATGLIIGMIVTAFVCGWVNGRETRTAYRAGQIDAANGVQHYRLTKDASGQTVWVEDGK